jgi:hypothetical protein
MKGRIISAFFYFLHLQFSKKIISWFYRQYALDRRALALMRVGIGLVLLIDLIIRSGSIKAHYTDEGVLPLHALQRFLGNGYNYSLHAQSGELYFQIFLFFTAILFSSFLIIGYHTRLATFVSWVLLASLQSRNPLIEQGGDDLLRLVLFWGIFLPWGDRYSADKIRKRNIETPAYFDVPALAYALLIFSVYFFSALMKTSVEWHSEGSALYYALSLDQLRLPLGDLLYPHAGLLKFLTHLTWYIELIAPFLLFVPVFNSAFRTIGIAAIISLHLGISAILFVGLFFLTGIASTLGLLPSALMDKLEQRFNFLIRPLTKIAGSFFQIKRPGISSPVIKNNFYSRLMLNSPLFFVMAYCLLWNMGSSPGSKLTVSENLRWIGYTLRLEQRWNMFSPEVMKEDGWFVTEGVTNDNRKIDISKNGGDVDYSKPGSILKSIENDRWRKFGESYMQQANEGIRTYYCRYLLRKWNRENPEKKISRLNVIYMRENSEPDYRHVIPVRDVLCLCGTDSLN